MAKATNKTVTITLIKSSIGWGERQQATLRGLGLRRLGSSKTLQDTPAVRGMIQKVQHLLKIDAA